MAGAAIYPLDAGLIRDPMRGIPKYGVCSEDDWPFDVIAITNQPSDEAFDKAASNTVNSFFRLDPDRPVKDNHNLTEQEKESLGAAVLDNLRNGLAEQYPIAFGLWHYLPVRESIDVKRRQRLHPVYLENTSAFRIIWA